MPPRTRCRLSSPQFSSAIRQTFLPSSPWTPALPAPFLLPSFLTPRTSHSPLSFSLQSVSLPRPALRSLSTTRSVSKKRGSDSTEALLDAAAELAPSTRRNFAARFTRPDRDDGIASSHVIILAADAAGSTAGSPGAPAEGHTGGSAGTSATGPTTGAATGSATGSTTGSATGAATGSAPDSTADLAGGRAPGSHGSLSRAQSLRDVLASFDRKTHFLIKVGQTRKTAENAPLEPRVSQRPRVGESDRGAYGYGRGQRRGTSGGGGGSGQFVQGRGFPPQHSAPGEAGAEAVWPVCKILPKKDVFEREAAKDKASRKQEMKAKRRDGKTVELGWTMADGDLKHRMKKAREILEEGERLSVVVDKKRKRDVIAPEVSSLLLEKVLAHLTEMKGVKESRRVGELGESLKIVFDRAKT